MMRQLFATWLAANFGLAVLFVGCTTKQAEDVTKVTAAILCAIEHAELDDADLNKACDLIGTLATEVKPALVAHRRALARSACKPTDAGVR